MQTFCNIPSHEYVIDCVQRPGHGTGFFQVDLKPPVPHDTALYDCIHPQIQNADESHIFN